MDAHSLTSLTGNANVEIYTACIFEAIKLTCKLNDVWRRTTLMANTQMATDKLVSANY